IRKNHGQWILGVVESRDRRNIEPNVDLRVESCLLRESSGNVQAARSSLDGRIITEQFKRFEQLSRAESMSEVSKGLVFGLFEVKKCRPHDGVIEFEIVGELHRFFSRQALNGARGSGDAKTVAHQFTDLGKDFRQKPVAGAAGFVKIN